VFQGGGRRGGGAFKLAICLLTASSRCCSSSVNEIICHGIPDMRPFENGDIVNLDISVFYKGHHTDLNETYFIGEVDEESVKLVETSYACLAAAVEMGACVTGLAQCLYCMCGCVISGQPHL
jgi:Xaa-Pro aminopeptidase